MFLVLLSQIIIYQSPFFDIGPKAIQVGMGAGSFMTRREFGLTAVISFRTNGDYAPSYLDYECPHSDYSIMGWYKDGSEYGIMIYYGIIEYPFTFLGELGLALQNYVYLVRSNVTGWYYAHDEESNFFPIFSIGIGIFFSPHYRLQVKISDRYSVLLGLTLAIQK